MSRPTILFDLDGTLVHSAPDLVGALNLVLAEEGEAPVDFDSGLRLIGHGGRIMVVNGFAARGIDLTAAPDRLERLASRFVAVYETRIAAETRPFPNVEATLARFVEADWRLGVCTNKSERLARLLLDQLDLSRLFHVITGADTFGIGKPDARPVLESIAAAGGDPSRAVLVGDSAADIAAARAAGIPVIAVTFGYTDRPVATLGPDRLVDDFADIWPAAETLIGR
jgi:phosphoglycolate phosphatase